MNTRVCAGNDVDDVLHSVDQAMADDFHPTLAVVFSSVAHDFARLGRDLGRRAMAVVGATTSGEIVNERLMEEACVVMLLEMAPEAFHVELRGRTNGQTLHQLAQEVGRTAVSRFEHPAVLVFASGLKSDGEEVVRGVPVGAGRDIPLFGGMAGDDLAMQNSFVFSATEASEEGLIALVLDGDRYQIEGIATSGWQPVGVEKTVTHSEANIVYTIDDEPALDVYRKYMHLDDLDLDAGEGIALALGVQYPLSMRRADGTTVIRAPLFFNPENNALIFAGALPQGARVKFCIPPSLDIVDRVVGEASEVHRAMPQADAVILVQCVARRIALGPLAEDEVEALYGLWKAPMLGYFSYGEIGGRTPDTCDLHNETCTMVALRERRN